MKKSGKRQLRLCFLVLALVLVSVGVYLIFGVFGAYETIAIPDADRAQLMGLLRLTSVRLLAGGALTVTGLCIGLILLLHLIRRTARIEKEARAIQKRSEAVERLAHHQRLETIGTLTASIAHEFNNLLTPIMGYSLMAMEKLPPGEEELYENLLEIYESSRKAKVIISRLSDLSRKNTSDTFRWVSPDELVGKTLDVAEPAKPKLVEVKRSLNCWDQRILANEIQIQQMLLNLILNGFHAMGDEPGTLTVETSFDEDSVTIAVSDTGCGIPEEIRDRIFEPFFTTKAAGEGTGLGLAIAAQVVEDHRGEIRVRSQEGQGTSFIIRLPRNLEPEEGT